MSTLVSCPLCAGELGGEWMGAHLEAHFGGRLANWACGVCLLRCEDFHGLFAHALTSRHDIRMATVIREEELLEAASRVQRGFCQRPRTPPPSFRAELAPTRRLKAEQLADQKRVDAAEMEPEFGDWTMGGANNVTFSSNDAENTAETASPEVNLQIPSSYPKSSSHERRYSAPTPRSKKRRTRSEAPNVPVPQASEPEDSAALDARGTPSRLGRRGLGSALPDTTDCELCQKTLRCVTSVRGRRTAALSSLWTHASRHYSGPVALLVCAGCGAHFSRRSDATKADGGPCAHKSVAQNPAAAQILSELGARCFAILANRGP